MTPKNLDHPGDIEKIAYMLHKGAIGTIIYCGKVYQITGDDDGTTFKIRKPIAQNIKFKTTGKWTKWVAGPEGIEDLPEEFMFSRLEVEIPVEVLEADSKAVVIEMPIKSAQEHLERSAEKVMA